MVFLPFFGVSQNASFSVRDITGTGSYLNGGEIIYVAAQPGVTTEHLFAIKNLTGVTQTISIRKDEIKLNTVALTDKAEAFFCTGVTCYASQVMTAIVEINAGQTLIFKAQFIEASIKAESEVSYKFSNNLVNEFVNFTLKYNNILMSLPNETAKGKTDLELSFENPTTELLNLKIVSLKDQTVSVCIFNSNAELISCEQLTLLTGMNEYKNKLTCMSGGMYYLNIAANGKSVNKKIILTNK